MIILRATGDLLRVITTAGGSDIECHVSSIETDNGTPPIVQDLPRTNTADITTATTTTILDCTTANRRRRVLFASMRNVHATVTETVELIHSDGTTVRSIIKVTLLPGESLIYNGVGTPLHYDANGALYNQSTKLDAKLVVTSDVINATTSFADVTGLQVALKSGKKYAWQASIHYQTDATTTGGRFGINIGAAPTVMTMSGIHQITNSVTAATYGSSAMVTARDTAAVVETTGPGASAMLALLNGYIQPSADGTFAVRFQSEVAVASGLTVKAGSWLRIWEVDN
jgi:hypothetical protein